MKRKLGRKLVAGNKTKKRSQQRTVFELPPGIEARYSSGFGVALAVPDGMERLVHVEYTSPMVKGKGRPSSGDYFISRGKALPPEAKNFVVQALAATQTKRAIVRCHKRLEDTHPDPLKSFIDQIGETNLRRIESLNLSEKLRRQRRGR